MSNNHADLKDLYEIINAHFFELFPRGLLKKIEYKLINNFNILLNLTFINHYSNIFSIHFYYFYSKLHSNTADNEPKSFTEI